jgi:hypothetical protein
MSAHAANLTDLELIQLVSLSHSIPPRNCGARNTA